MLWTGFLLGLFGSLHCLGMCGPIALSLPGGYDKGNYLTGRILYNIGRMVTYAVLGVVIGLFGSALNFSGWQQALSIAAGVLILLSLVSYWKSKLDVNFIKPLQQLSRWVKKQFGKLYTSKSIFKHLGIGIVNGFIPCGLVYVALAASLAFGSLTESALYMVLFGAGTFPMMFAISFSGRFIGAETRVKLNRLVPYFIAILGILFIVRGLNLDIPMLSPDISASPAAAEWGEVCQ